MRKGFLLEIGCENLPSAYLDDTLKQVRDIFESGLSDLRIELDSLSVLGTPRRVVVHIEALAIRQRAEQETIVGPPVKAAVSPDGSYTKAATGFAGSQGVSVEKLARIETPRGEYIAVVRKVSGRSTASVLREQIPLWLSMVRFPKVMRWDSTGFVFARPVRWITAFLGDRPLKLVVGGLVSGARTRLSPYFDSYEKIGGIEDYLELMKTNRIVIDQRERRKMVARMARRAAGSVSGILVEDDELVTIVTNLLESPVALVGRFADSHLELPKEVIITALKSHQRYFSVVDERGALMPHFIAFTDGIRRNKAEIVRGYEKVLSARLADAEFYFREDTSRPLESMAGKLDGIVWLEGLGTLAQKSERLGKLALWLLEELNSRSVELSAKVERAARLAKADLASEMVKDGKEFTLLQGYIGREYARASGEDGDVAEAIFEHYLPRYPGDGIPESEAGTMLALADRVDTMAGCFLAGLDPTGSQDPYALRRSASGLIRILRGGKLGVRLSGMLEYAVDLYMEEGIVTSSMDRGKFISKVREFIAQRLNTMLRAEDFDYDLVSAVLGSPWEMPSAACDTVKELQRMRSEGELEVFALAMKRISNILPKDRRGGMTARKTVEILRALEAGDEKGVDFSRSLFTEKAEDELYKEVISISGDILRMYESGRTDEGLGLLAGLAPSVNRYFDDVLVNCDEKRIRDNRISFLTALHASSALFCDFSSIVIE